MTINKKRNIINNHVIHLLYRNIMQIIEYSYSPNMRVTN